MNANDRFKIECELIEYFSQFSEQGVIISLYKGNTEIPVKLDKSGNMESITTPDKADRIYFIPPQDNKDYAINIFESFYQLYLIKKNIPEPLFLKREIKDIENKYNDEVLQKYPILDYWKYFLETKLKTVKNNTHPKTQMTFESLFRDKDKAKEVKQIFETRGYTINSQWQGLSGKDSELLAAYHVLKDNNLLKPGKITPQATVFYKEFGLTVGKNNTNKGEYITDRQLRNTPPVDDVDQFIIIFSCLLPKK